MRGLGWMVSVMVVGCCLLVVASGVQATTYYVDFDGGSDFQNGTSPSTPFKHSPGDSSAAGTAGATNLQPGDTVIFKGGVHYRGNFRAGSSGAAGNPITFDGNTAGAFGTGRAIIDGSEPLTGWTRCASAAEAGGNPNWANIYYAYAPAGLNPGTANLYENNQMCWMAQDPNQPDPFFMDQISNFYTIPHENMTATSVVDPVHLNQSDPNYWNGAYVMVWGVPNVVRYQKILSFDPAENKITYEAAGSPYTDRDEHYAIYNSIHLIDTPGEYFFNDTPEPDGRHKVYLWPQTPGDINEKEITASVRTVGMDIGGVNYVTVAGFRIQKQSGSQLHDGIGIKVYQWNLSPKGIIIRDNDIFGIRHHPERGYGAIYLAGGVDCLIEGNTIQEMPVNMGILCGGGSNIVVRDNYLRKCGQQSIWFMDVQGGQILRNEVRGGRGSHANGISVYQNSSNILIFGNKVFDSNIALTTERSTNLTVAYNVLYRSDAAPCYADWGNTTNLKVYNNVILQAGNGQAALYIGSSTTGWVVRNNILAGFGPGPLPNLTHNIYVTLSWNQQPRYGWSLGDGETVEQDLGAIFVDPANHDYRLKVGSPAIDAGVDVGQTQDLDGHGVPAGSAVDIGAFEYASAPPQIKITGWYTLVSHGGNEIAARITEGLVDSRAAAISKLQVNFSGALNPATVNNSSLAISGDTSGDLSGQISNLSLVDGSKIVVTLSSALPNDERFTLTVSPTVADASGRAVTGDRDIRLAVLAGDVDGNGTVDALDQVAIRLQSGRTVGAATARYDIDASGQITMADLRALRAHLGNSLP
ncbi:MAG: hypothetical protein GWP05_08660 [Anaerolineaceae bacterium]|nr:hypothetical protein [Anaerolineaceae bacterium]